MSTLNHIPAQQLPLNQDFKSLKAAGLAYIQAYSGPEWTNFNASDPGVTILDQLCYALTELGYCNDFTVSDILTDYNGNLLVKDQFYLPENILTTSPVTITDYRKYIIDGVEGVTNVFIPFITGTVTGINIYPVYLQIDGAIIAETAITAICNAAFFYLNKRRNLGEWFSVLPLVPNIHYITGIIELTDAAIPDSILVQMNNNIRNFIFPQVVPSGYDQLLQNGAETNEIFNGPLLQNGWIPTAALGQKQDALTTIDLITLIEALPGVISVSGLNFDGLVNKSLNTDATHVLVIDLESSLKKGLEIWCNGIQITNKSTPKLNTALSKSQGTTVNIEFGAAVDVQTEPPTGKYRDINNYYSIQNTFPEIFAVGADTINSNATNFQIAQSRQLKGFLTLFDQVLANQFSQLANIGRLFSFKNSTSGTPSDEEEFYAVKDKYERKHLEYPVPYKTFSPTYFYQALYDVPHIKPLLKNNDAFKFTYELETGKELGQNSWKAYKLDPYNPYIRGVMDFMEDEQMSVLRRNDILDHLLARHGESPLMFNTFINGSVYSGDTLQDQVIFKSLYLQNLGLLSYFRQKAYCFTSAIIISDKLTEVPADFERKILGGDINNAIFNSPKVDRIEQLKETDFDNYSGIELKLSLFFGLKVLYKNFIANNFKDVQSLEVKIALWMISKRKGMMMLEMGLLLNYLRFTIIITNNPTGAPFYRTNADLDYPAAVNIYNALKSDTRVTIDIQTGDNVLIVNDIHYTLVPIVADNCKCRYLKPIPNTNFYFSVMRVSGPEIDVFENQQLFNNIALFLFPAFVLPANSAAFTSRLKLFLNNELPVQIPGQCYFIGTADIQALIPAFCAWHNCLVFPDPENDLSNEDPSKFYSGKNIKKCAWELALVISTIKLIPA